MPCLHSSPGLARARQRSTLRIRRSQQSLHHGGELRWYLSRLLEFRQLCPRHCFQCCKCIAASTVFFLLTTKGEWEDTESTDGSRRRHEGGGIDLSDRFQQAVSVSGEVSDTLIDSEFSYKTANATKPGTWSEVAGTRSWHTGTATASSTRSDFDPNRYGRPETRSVSGSVHSFNSSIAERSQSGSDHIEMRNSFAKVKAYVSASLWLASDCIVNKFTVVFTLS